MPGPDMPEDCDCCPERCMCGDCGRCEWTPPVPPPGLAPNPPRLRRPGPAGKKAAQRCDCCADGCDCADCPVCTPE